MTKGAAFITLIVATIAGLIASYSISHYVQAIQAQNENQINGWAWVVYATKEIPAGVKIQPDMVSRKHMPPDGLPEGIFSEMETVKDRVPTDAIYPGEIILQKRLAGIGTPAGLPAMIPNGFRAITLKVDDTIGVGGFIQPGNFVDVLTTVDLGQSGRELVSKVILQNVLVIATGNDVDSLEDKKAKVVPTVTVLVSLEKAERLSLATNAGSIRLVLRNHADKEEEITDGVTLANLIPQVNQEQRDLPEPEPVEAEPEEPKKQVHVVEVYRGSEKSEITFER